MDPHGLEVKVPGYARVHTTKDEVNVQFKTAVTLYFIGGVAIFLTQHDESSVFVGTCALKQVLPGDMVQLSTDEIVFDLNGERRVSLKDLLQVDPYSTHLIDEPFLARKLVGLE